MKQNMGSCTPPEPSVDAQPQPGPAPPNRDKKLKVCTHREGLIPPLFLPHSPQGQGSLEDPQAQHVQGALEPPRSLSSLWAHQDLAPPKMDGARDGAESQGAVP